MKRVLFATDLDGTLIGDPIALAEFNTFVNDIRKTVDFKLVYVTARSLESYHHLLESSDLMKPDALVTSLGTRMYTGSDLQLIDTWPVVINWNPLLIRKLLSDLDCLTDQPLAEQNEHKVSYYIDSQQSLDIVQQKLKNLNLEAIFSGKRYIDILPKGVHKGSAAEYLAKLWYIDTADLITAGDSRNDIDMLKPYKSVVVSNAQEGLLEWVRESSLKNVYVAKNTFAEGVVEGLRHYGL